MNKTLPKLSASFALAGLALCVGVTHSSAANPPEDGNGAYVTGKYRNLFAEAGHSQAEIRAKVDGAFQQLFHGDPATQAIYYEAGSNSNGPLAYITDIKNDDVRTEGLSYGMIICAELGKKKEFDALWNWSNTHLYHDDPKDPGYGFYAWQAGTNGQRYSQGIAPDGEEYYTMALYFAAGRWGSGEGLYNYKAQADALLKKLRHREWIIGVQPPLPPRARRGGGGGGGGGAGFGGGFGGGQTNAGGTNAPRGGGGGFGGRGGGLIGSGPLFDEETKMVLFTPENSTNRSRPYYTDPSYHLPAFYELWARWGAPEDRDFWMQAAQNSRDYFSKVAHPVTGLTPHDSNFDASLRGGGRGAATNPAGAGTNAPRRGGGGFGGGFGGPPHFDYDAFRTAGNWSVDWSWWAKDPRERELSDKIQAFFESKGMTNYGCQFSLDGSQTIDERHAQGLVAVNADASLAATNEARAKEFVEALWNTPTPDGRERYYEGLLYMMALLHCSGEFQILPPK